MIALETARQLIDFGGRIGPDAAEEQLRGSVALHNLLEANRVAYLADEVGMGKTYVALGAFALFRHFDPGFRLLVIAPRENIQKKWRKELVNFVANNVRFPDLRVKAVHGAPARSVVHCDSLLDLVRETTLDPDRDFISRLTSFSLPLGKDSEGWKSKRDALLRHLPWLDRELLDLRDRERFKEHFARAVNCALPVFDLVIVDEGHNLKGGYRTGSAARNRVLALVFGHPSGRGDGAFHGYASRAKRVLFLSATPLEDDYLQLWNQLDVFGLGRVAPVLKEPKASADKKLEAARCFLVRRVTAMNVGGQSLTKNLYRREWRGGGVRTHDDPLDVPDARQRLAVALIQKKVSELLGSERFNNSFQIGMLASFESFLETSRVAKGEDDAGEGNFDDAEQTDDIEERIGIDVGAVNRLARDYRRRFGSELPHPKMDSLVDSMTESLRRGRKALVFVRRTASVKEIQRKIEERYDSQLFTRLRMELRAEVQPALERIIARYREERIARRHRTTTHGAGSDGGDAAERADQGGIETFFAWFFRGEGPTGVLSGVTVQKRFSQAGSFQSTFFEDNHVAWVLGVDPSEAWEALLRSTSRPDSLVDDLRARAGQQLKRRSKQPRRELFFAFQHAAIALLAREPGAVGERAKVVMQERYFDGPESPPGAVTAPDPRDWLVLPTFWTELRRHPDLHERLWPRRDTPDLRVSFRDQEVRRELLSAMIRLGNPMIDLYVLTVNRLGSIQLRRREQEDEGDQGLIGEFIELLQRQAASSDDSFCTFRELAEAAENFDLIVDVNAPRLRKAPLAEAATEIGRLLREQQPVGGMFGAVNETLVRQFRMPGYPFVLVSTDLLQEGEDLHTFCSDVHHYGISWMPSSMEQRIGRIDRVSSQTERRLTRLGRAPSGEELLQVYYPHLQDTVEVLQVRRVLRRMNRFLRLMHRDIGSAESEDGRLDVDREILKVRHEIEQLKEPLRTAFPIQEEMLRGPARELAVSRDETANLLDRFCSLAGRALSGLKIEWEERAPDNALMGTVRVRGRQQPFTLLLSSTSGALVVRCVSPIGRLLDGHTPEDIERAAAGAPVRIGAVRDDRFDSYDFTVESDVLLGHKRHDEARVGALLRRVIEAADRIEHELLERDEPIATFRDDLELEPKYER